MNYSKVNDNIFIKLNKIFKSIYITNIGYVIAESIQPGLSIGILDYDILDYLQDEVFKTKNIIYIPDIKEYRSDNSKYSIIDVLPKDISGYLEINENYIKNIDWKDVPFGDIDNDLNNKLFDLNESIEIYCDGCNSITITKSLFPIVTKKTCINLKYGMFNFEFDRNVKILLFNFKIEGISIYWIYAYSRFKD